MGATGWGLAAAAQSAAAVCGFDLAGARVAVQGFGAVGKHAARFLADLGAVLVAASDTRGTLVDARGIAVNELMRIKEGGGSVLDYSGGHKLAVDAVIDVPCDIWIPAARPDVIRGDNAARLNAQLVLQGANIPCTAEAEHARHRRGVIVAPDFVANAGGVICAAMEYQGATRQAAIAEKVGANTSATLKHARAQNITPREAATALAKVRVLSAMQTRRFRLF